jgi:hypothetical protein
LSPGRLDRVKASLKPRPRAPKAKATPPPAQPAAPTAAAIPGDLIGKRERLEREYAGLQSDLGGLVYEMAIRDAYRLDLITRRAAQLQAVDAQLTEVERSIAAASQPPAPVAPVQPPPAAAPASAPAPAAAPAAAAPSCPSCGKPVEPGAIFCGSCGASLQASTPPPSTAPPS